MSRLILSLLVAASTTASPIIIRHDVDDARYRIPASEFPALVDMPHEGHGVLIAPQWIVTVAHTTLWNPEEITLNGVRRKVERVIVHPGYEKLSDDLIAQAMKSGDASRLMEFQASNDDIALLKLSTPVTDVAPATIYRDEDESGKEVKLIGKGATGNGCTGQEQHASHRTVLRRAYNTISRTDGHWLVYRFDAGPSAHPLEGMSGSGDSGGPVLIEVDGEWQLAGLAAWDYVRGDLAEFRVGFYGQDVYNVRLSSYADWIDSVISSEDGTAQRKAGD